LRGDTPWSRDDDGAAGERAPATARRPARRVAVRPSMTIVSAPVSRRTKHDREHRGAHVRVGQARRIEEIIRRPGLGRRPGLRAKRSTCARRAASSWTSALASSRPSARASRSSGLGRAGRAFWSVRARRAAGPPDAQREALRTPGAKPTAGRALSLGDAPPPASPAERLPFSGPRGSRSRVRRPTARRPALLGPWPWSWRARPRPCGLLLPRTPAPSHTFGMQLRARPDLAGMRTAATIRIDGETSPPRRLRTCRSARAVIERPNRQKKRAGTRIGAPL